MNSTEEVHVASTDRRDAPPGSSLPDPLPIKVQAVPVRRAIVRTREWLLRHQNADGHWCAELEGDTITASETILLLAFLGREDSALAKRMAEYLLEKQLPEGGWAMYPGGRVEISSSVKAYFALKLTGHDPGTEYMQRAREMILAHGGADRVNSYTRFYLALLGQISYDHCPAVPPEAVLLPKWSPINLTQVSAWSRTIIVPLSIVSAKRPVRQIDVKLGIRELFVKAPDDWPALRCPGLPGGTGLFSWDCFFRTADRLMKWCQRRRILPLRRRAIAAAEKWMLARFERSDGLGAIYPPIVWCVLALKCLGYDESSPEMKECMRQLNDLLIEDDRSGTTRVQPCKSPVWDTAITLKTLAGAGIGRDATAMREAVDWLLDRQVDQPGDWRETVDAEPAAWAFEYHNDFYPDVDDTAAVLLALKTRLAAPTETPEALPPHLRLHPIDGDSTDDETAEVARIERTNTAIDRGLKWLLAMQNDDGGWGAFDRNNNKELLCYVPFADHNAMIDPSTVDLTGGVLETLGKLGRRVGDPAVDRAVEFIFHNQEADGSWFGRWGVNYIYGTWKAICGLIAVGVPADDRHIVAGVNWLLAHQQASGGWGESPDSYEKPQLRGQGNTTASQTAWAVLALLAAGHEKHKAVTRAVGFLTMMQEEDGSWDEPEFTGTGFPQVYYLRYHYYPIYYPLAALAQWAMQVEPVLADDSPPSLRLVSEEAMA